MRDLREPGQNPRASRWPRGERLRSSPEGCRAGRRGGRRPGRKRQRGVRGQEARWLWNVAGGGAGVGQSRAQEESATPRFAGHGHRSRSGREEAAKKAPAKGPCRKRAYQPKPVTSGTGVLDTRRLWACPTTTRTGGCARQGWTAGLRRRYKKFASFADSPVGQAGMGVRSGDCQAGTCLLQRGPQRIPTTLYANGDGTLTTLTFTGEVSVTTGFMRLHGRRRLI